ncbi:glycerate kinase family protein [Actinophytocola gossypii]|uniref:Glycerate kinase n=1 Tax=Actinophytocola gossypii TaxID=2812003 RepID=A0ABT2J8B9_9PSEU|nr:glycerate kinase [Actinophytocola gossypii]MCT2584117.1 glycerate kinase [Actinophytocola gossypii]
MRVLIAPDCFGGTLTAPEAAEAIAAGWRGSAPDDELTLCPLADGGPGFVDVLHSALDGTLHRVSVTGPRGEAVDAVWLEHDGTAYLECAQACGLHLVPKGERDALTATTLGVGELVADALRANVHTIVVGLGGSATTDGGAGLFHALGAVPTGENGGPLPPGGAALVDAVRLDGGVDLGGVTLVAASDVENPLLGKDGAARVFGPQKGADDLAVRRLERSLTRWADVLAEVAGRDVRDEPGAGAAGGLGAALIALGATVESGAGIVRRLTGLDTALDTAQLVITGEGSFDFQSLRGKLVTRVAAASSERGTPCLVLAGVVSVGRRRAAAAGVDRAYSVAEHVGSPEASLADPEGTLTALAKHVSAQWRR